MKQGNLFVITGPSGVGKGTLIESFLDNNPDVDLSISATTRNPRPNEANGVNYHFISKEEFEASIEKDMFIEWAKFADNYYGTFEKTVQESMTKGKNIIVEIEIQGALQVKEKMPEAIMIFILPPSLEDLKKRLRGRNTEDEATIQKRFSVAESEIAQSNTFDYKIVNDDLNTALNNLSEVVNAKR